MNIVVVSKPGCPWCDKVKALLKMQGVAFTERLLVTPEEQAEFCRKENVTTFPQVAQLHPMGLDIYVIGGFEATQAWIQKGGHLT